MDTTTYGRRGEHSFAALSTGRPRSPVVSDVLAAVNRQAGGLMAVTDSTAPTGIPPRAILALMVYYYAMGVLASHDIERAFARNSHLRLVSHDEFPNWRQLRRFRRANREVVRQCIADVLGAGNLPFPHGDLQARLEEAEHRVAEAALLDRYFADE